MARKSCSLLFFGHTAKAVETDEVSEAARKAAALRCLARHANRLPKRICLRRVIIQQNTGEHCSIRQDCQIQLAIRHQKCRPFFECDLRLRAQQSARNYEQQKPSHGTKDYQIPISFHQPNPIVLQILMFTSDTMKPTRHQVRKLT